MVPKFPPFNDDVDTATAPVFVADPFGMNDKSTDKALDELADSLFGEDPKAAAPWNNLDPWDGENSFISSSDVLDDEEDAEAFADLLFPNPYRESLEMNANPFGDDDTGFPDSPNIAVLGSIAESGFFSSYCCVL